MTIWIPPLKLLLVMNLRWEASLSIRYLKECLNGDQKEVREEVCLKPIPFEEFITGHEEKVFYFGYLELSYEKYK